MNRYTKLASAAFALALTAGAGMALTASPAVAAATANSCKVLKGTSAFTPPVSPTKAQKGTITSHGTVTGCAPAAQTGGSGVFNSSLKDTKAGNCSTLVKGGNVLTGTASTTWKNKKVTKMSVTVKTGTGKSYNIATITGVVTSGLFKGKHVTGQVKFTPKTGNCVTTPLKSVSFTSTKPFALH